MITVVECNFSGIAGLLLVLWLSCHLDGWQGSSEWIGLKSGLIKVGSPLGVIMQRIMRRSHAYEWGVHWTRRWRVRAHTRKCALAEGRRAPSAVKYPRPHWQCALMTSPITKLYERDTAGEFEYLEYHTLLRKISG